MARARRKKAKKTESTHAGSGATTGHEAALWAMADALRGSMDAAEYKHVVLGLIFLKYISDAFEEMRTRLEGEVAQGADPEDPDEYRAENIFWVPPEARWSHLKYQARQPTIGQIVDDAMVGIERDNPVLKDVLPKEYARPALDKQRLGQLIDMIGNIKVGDADARSRDVLGHVYEYFLSQFASAEGKKGGEFYTPRCVVKLLVKMLKPYKGRVYDPCCGSSGMFVQSIEFIRAHASGNGNGGKARGDISIYGQESNYTTWRLAKMNLAIRGIEGQIAHGNSFHNDRHREQESRRAGKRQAAPFSKDKPKRDPKKPGRKPGSKYGRQAVRAIPVPDKTFEAPCPEQCPCGGKVGAEGSIDLYQVDIPPIQPETWKFVVGHGHCQECGRRVRGQHPLLISKAFEVGTVHFGPRLLAFAAFQKMICGVSYDKIRLGFEQMLGFPVARSTLCRAMQRLARRAKPTRDALVEALRASPVVYADETGWKQGGRRVWLWVFTNLRETVYEILPGRGFEQAASVLGKNYAGTLGVDGWAPYRCFKEATLQTCYNHLLHRCHELLETATRGAVRFPRLVKAILRHALALRDRRDAGEISPHGLRVAKGLLQAKMNRLLHGRFTNPANQRFAKHLRRYRDNLFVFLDRADVEATNYPAEQDIRIAVVNRKTCGGGNRTAKGAQAQSILMSVLQSCRHKGIRVIDIVTSILRAPDNTPVPLVNPER